MRYLCLIVVVACAPTPQLGRVSLTFPQTLDSARLVLSCARGDTYETTATLGGAFEWTVPACGEALLSFTGKSNDILAMRGASSVNVTYGSIDVTIAAQQLGLLSLDTPIACTARVRNASGLEVFTGPAPALVSLPVGDYNATCDDALGNTTTAAVSVGFASKTVGFLKAPPKPDAIAPSIVSFDLPNLLAIGTTQVGLTLVFSEPVRGVDAGTQVTGGGTLAPWVTTDAITWTSTLSNLVPRGHYTVGVDASVVSVATGLAVLPSARSVDVDVPKVYVNGLSGGARFNGLTPATPRGDIASGLAVAQNLGTVVDILVTEGMYSSTGPLSVDNGYRILGGYALDFSLRDPVAHVSQYLSSVSGVTLQGASILEGFTVGGVGTTLVTLASGSPALRGCIVSGTSISGACTTVSVGPFSNAIVEDNTLVGCDSSSTAAFVVDATSAPLVQRNSITGGNGTTSVAVKWLSNDGLLVGNALVGGSGSSANTLETVGSPVVANNRIFTGTSVSPHGIECQTGIPTIVNNTIVLTNPLKATGIYMSSSCYANIVNNLFVAATAASGAMFVTDNAETTFAYSLHNNVFRRADASTVLYRHATAFNQIDVLNMQPECSANAETNVSLADLFVDFANDDLRLGAMPGVAASAGKDPTGSTCGPAQNAACRGLSVDALGVARMAPYAAGAYQ